MSLPLFVPFCENGPCIKNKIIKYADMEAPIKTNSGHYYRATSFSFLIGKYRIDCSDTLLLVS